MDDCTIEPGSPLRINESSSPYHGHVGFYLFDSAGLADFVYVRLGPYGKAFHRNSLILITDPAEIVCALLGN